MAGGPGQENEGWKTTEEKGREEQEEQEEETCRLMSSAAGWARIHVTRPPLPAAEQRLGPGRRMSAVPLGGDEEAGARESERVSERAKDQEAMLLPPARGEAGPIRGRWGRPVAEGGWERGCNTPRLLPRPLPLAAAYPGARSDRDEKK